MKWLWLSVVIVIADQLSKAFAQQALNLFEPVRLTPYLNLTLMHNTGIAFSLFDQADARWFLVGLAAVVSVAIIVWLRFSESNRWLQISLSLVVGGAIGNLWDRVVLGYVIDFIDFRYQTLWWPAFNIADAAICVGAAMLIIDSFKSQDAEG